MTAVRYGKGSHLSGRVSVQRHDSAMIRIVDQGRPENLIAAFVIFFGSGQIAVYPVGVAVQEKERILGLLPHIQ